MIRIYGLCKRYSTADGDIIALDNVSLHINHGDFAAIIGRSGSGKTTLLNMIAGLDVPDRGSIMFDGMDIAKLSAERTAILRRREIGVIYQFYNLIPELTVKENIFLPSELDGRETDPEKLTEILNTVGLGGRDNAYPGTLSGGEQQRVAIARALLGGPSLILADEPTGNLDGENSAEVIGLLRSLNEKRGVTVLMVTHNEEIARGAGRLITIAHGKITGDIRNV